MNFSEKLIRLRKREGICNDDRMASAAQVRLAFFNQQSAGHCCTMDNRVVYNKIAASFSWRVRNRSAMNLKCIFRHNKT